MQSENFDKKIKDSLSQRPPGNDTPAWDKMETLLDRHMPRERKDRRKVFVIMFLFLLIGGGIFLIWQNSGGDKNNISAVEPQNKNPESTNNNNSPAPTDEKESAPATLIVQPPSNREVTNVPGKNISSINPRFVLADASISKFRNQKAISNATENNTAPFDNINNKAGKENQPEKTDDVVKDPSPISTDKNEPIKTETQNPINENKTAEQKPETKESQPLLTKKSTPQNQKGKRSFFDNLFFTASAGPDISTVELKTGKVQLAYGVGVGYQISNKFSIRTGIYTARKVYSADPDDYYPPDAFWTWYPNLKNIDANCKVREIPVTIDYTISQTKKGSWFASGGVSSLIMKEETYDYYFKPNSSPTYITYTRTIHDQNKHYFSQLNFSGGYTRNLNNNISLRAEPYVKIAMHGVGFGKVNLNSGGVVFSAIVKPFAKK